jgi:hypothetical protein
MRRHYKPLALLLSAAQMSCQTAPPTDPQADTDTIRDNPPTTVTPNLDSDSEPAVEPINSPRVTVLSSGPRPCTTPTMAGGPFFEVRSGTSVAADTPFVLGGNVSIASLDSDPIPDVIVVNQRSVRILYPLAGKGGEGEVILEIEEDSIREGLFSASAADYDGDGDFDLYITRHPGENFLLSNNGQGSFTDVTAEAGVAGPDTHWSGASSWGDYDLDGDLDLVVAGYGLVVEDRSLSPFDFEPGDDTLLYTNQGDGTFVDDRHLISPDAQRAYTFIAGFHDLNGDMRPDLYMANDFAAKIVPSHGMINIDGAFVTDAADPSMRSNVIGMGLAVDDINDDGLPDIMLPGWNDLALITSQQGEWFDVSQSTSVEPDSDRNQKIAWGSDFGDINNDGRLDLLVSYGYLDSRDSLNHLRQPDSVYIQTDDLVFAERSERLGLDQSLSTRSVVMADLNDDGWLDVVKGSANDDVRMFIAECAADTWSRIKLRQEGMNRYAVGARIRVTHNGVTQTRHILAGGHGYGSSRPPEVHVGLGTARRIDHIEITWPDGQVDSLYNQPTLEILTISR